MYVKLNLKNNSHFFCLSNRRYVKLFKNFKHDATDTVGTPASKQPEFGSQHPCSMANTRLSTGHPLSESVGTLVHINIYMYIDT